MRGVIIYMMIYMIMTLGSFACVIAMARKGRQVEEIADLAGLARTDKLLAFVLAMLMFSLAGIPPLAGFFAKYFVFLAAIKADLVTLAGHRRRSPASSVPITISASSRSCISTIPRRASIRCMVRCGWSRCCRAPSRSLSS